MSEQAAKTTMLVPNRFGRAEHVRTKHVATIEAHTNVDELLRPDFWSLVAKIVQVLDIIEVRSEDGRYWGEFLVTSCDRNWVKVRLLREHKFDAEQQVGSAADEFTVEWKGPVRKWSVIRNSDNSIVHEGESEKLGASNWLEGYAKTIGVGIKKAA